MAFCGIFMAWYLIIYSTVFYGVLGFSRGPGRVPGLLGLLGLFSVVVAGGGVSSWGGAWPRFPLVGVADLRQAWRRWPRLLGSWAPGLLVAWWRGGGSWPRSWGGLACLGWAPAGPAPVPISCRSLICYVCYNYVLHVSIMWSIIHRPAGGARREGSRRALYSPLKFPGPTPPE